MKSEYLIELRTELQERENQASASDERLEALERGLREARHHERRCAELAEQLAQPRFVLADRLNSWLRERLPPVHRLLKRIVLRSMRITALEGGKPGS